MTPVQAHSAAPRAENVEVAAPDEQTNTAMVNSAQTLFQQVHHLFAPTIASYTTDSALLSTVKPAEIKKAIGNPSDLTALHLSHLIVRDPEGFSEELHQKASSTLIRAGIKNQIKGHYEPKETTPVMRLFKTIQNDPKVPAETRLQAIRTLQPERGAANLLALAGYTPEID